METGRVARKFFPGPVQSTAESSSHSHNQIADVDKRDDFSFADANALRSNLSKYRFHEKYNTFWILILYPFLTL